MVASCRGLQELGFDGTAKQRTNYALGGVTVSTLLAGTKTRPLSQSPHGHAYSLACGHNLLCHVIFLIAKRRVTGRMVVHQYDCTGVHGKSKHRLVGMRYMVPN